MPQMDFLLMSGYGIAAIIAILSLRHFFSKRSRLPLPPSPRGLPIIGNILDMSGDKFHVQARDFSRQIGEDVVSYDILGKTTIVLNSMEATSDLLDKRGSNYTDRPSLPMIVDLMGWNWTVALFRYGPQWKEHRRVFHSNFNEPVNVQNYQHLQPPIVKELLVRILNNPNEFQSHVRLHTAAVIMKRTYGHRVSDPNDPYVRLADDASRSTSEAAVPGAFWVDLFPILKYVPEWVPGAGFQTQARKWRELSTAMVEKPFNMVKDKMKKGVAEPSFVSNCLEKNIASPADALSEEVIKSIAAVAYAGGADTSVSVIVSFILAMTIYPDVQKRAYKELESVTGGERMPNYGDRPNMPFLGAILKEAFRWIPVLPLALPHRASKADQYKGYYIPADATVLGNAWAILHDDRVYTDPEEFKPQRFLENPSLPDPADVGSFGFGRRACAGKNMAMDTIWIVMASILAVFDISKALDENGNEITPGVILEPGTINHPAPFKCKITPRSKAAAELLNQE